MIVIGGSAGSIESLKTIVSGLPPNFPATICIVVHMPPGFPSKLARVLSKSGPIPATNPADGQRFERGHIYVSRPDHHLEISDGAFRVLRGPRENRHRPAIDPLFRSAARKYGPRVIGIVLSGLQDDGSSGLYAVKRRGGIAIVQDPRDAVWSHMPQRALAYADPDYVLQIRDIAPNLIALVQAVETTTPKNVTAMPKKKNPRTNGKNHRDKIPASSGVERPEGNLAVAHSDEGEGMPSVFACPECHGVLWEIKNGELVRFRCRVGHSYGTESLTRELSEASETALWAAVRALEEKSAMQRRVAEGVKQNTTMAARLLDQSSADATSARLIREMIFHRDAELEPAESASKSQARKIA